MQLSSTNHLHIANVLQNFQPYKMFQEHYKPVDPDQDLAYCNTVIKRN